jgi:hypothetical protein
MINIMKLLPMARRSAKIEKLIVKAHQDDADWINANVKGWY